MAVVGRGECQRGNTCSRELTRRSARSRTVVFSRRPKITRLCCNPPPSCSYWRHDGKGAASSVTAAVEPESHHFAPPRVLPELALHCQCAHQSPIQPPHLDRAGDVGGRTYKAGLGEQAEGRDDEACAETARDRGIHNINRCKWCRSYSGCCTGVDTKKGGWREGRGVREGDEKDERWRNE